MKKAEYIKRYGEAAYEMEKARSRVWNKAHREEKKAADKRWREEHPEQAIANNKKWREEHLEEAKVADKRWREEHSEEVKANNREHSRKGGKRYDKQLEYMRTGIQGDKNKIRARHCRQYKPYKDIIAPESQLHHEWVPETDEYRGVALVEANSHRYGIIDVIEILDGKITLLTEEEVREGKRK